MLDWLTLGTLTDTTGSGLGGSQPWSFAAQDKNFDYLAAGEKLTLTYTVQVDDRNGGVVSQDVTIVVTGTNDTPVITSGAQSGAITEETNRHQPNPTGSSDLDKANGAVTFTDVDLSDQHQVTVTGVVASGVTTGLATSRGAGLADARHADRHDRQRAWRFAALELRGAGQELRLSGGRREADADLHGAGRRPQRRRGQPGCHHHRHRHQRHAGDSGRRQRQRGCHAD